MKTLKKFNNILYGQRAMLLLAALFGVFAAGVSMLPQQVVRFTVDNVIGQGQGALPGILGRIATWFPGRTVWMQNLLVCTVGILLIAVVNMFCHGMRTLLFQTAAERTSKKLRDRLYDHIQRLSYAYHINSDTGDLLQRCTSDVDTIRRFFAVQMMEVVRAVFIIVFSLIIMLPMNVKMTFISLISAPFLILFSYLYYGSIRKNFRLADESEGRMSVVLQENLTGVRVVRAFARQKYEAEKFDRASAEYRDLARRLTALMGRYWGITDITIFLQQGLTIVFGVSLVLSGEMTVGTLMSFISYTTMMLFPIRAMGRVLADMGKALVSVERINEILNVPIETDGQQVQTPEIRGSVRFSDVWFSYEGGQDVLRGISFAAKPGETTAILGATGSGKSTLMLLMQRLYSPTRGSIWIDGVDIQKIEMHHLRKNVSIVLQEPFLYSRTIAENIAITRPEASMEEIVEAAKMAAIHDDIMEFDQGYDTLVGERGVTLSGGQKQRVAIARTLLQNAPIIIFDDALSAMDTQTDAAIRRALERVQKDHTVFIISHRINSLAQADRILVLEEGRILQQGTHEELIRQPGIYRDVYEIQSSIRPQKEGD